MHNYWLACTFSTLREPCAETFSKALGREAEACFQEAVGHRQRVVKIRRIGEIAHAELIKPFQRAGLALSANHQKHLKFLDVHNGIIPSRVRCDSAVR